MSSKAVAVIAAVLSLLVAVSDGSPECFDVTQYFTFTANSTCGDPPTTFLTENGDELNCTLGDHDASFAVDRDSETWWQSEPGVDQVELLFTLREEGLSLRLQSVRLFPRAGPPLLLLIEGRGRGGEGFSLFHAYVTNITELCAEFLAQGVPCSSIYDTVDPVFGGVLIDLSPLPMPIEAFRMVTAGFFSNVTRYRTAEEIVLQGYVADGFYVPSVQAVSVEGEAGVEVSSLQTVATGSNEELFPGFRGRGYAALEYDTTQRVMVQWLLPSLPRDSSYQLLFRYAMVGGASQRLIATVMQGSQAYETRVTLQASCIGTTCHAFFSDSIDVNTPALLELSQGPLSIIITLSSVDILLDSIIAVPQEFYAPTTLDDPARFLSNCNIAGDFDLSSDAEFCSRSAVQLSTEFYLASFPCACQQPGSTGSECSVHGGQCDCLSPSDGLAQPNGRQCSVCPFVSFITPQGCAACACPTPLDDCEPTTGQCQDCPPLVGGLSCDRCVENSFGDPSFGCQPCVCNSTGTSACNQTSGECICLEGVAGASCDQCAEDAFNFTPLGCTACACSEPGSVGDSCDEDGQCQCKAGVGGVRCSECLPGFYFLSETGCTPCNCSGRSNVCVQDSLVTSDPREVCTCPFPYEGPSCEQCITPGFYLLPPLLLECAACQCNGRAESCEDGTGVCVDCTGDTTGDSCEVCAEGFFDTAPDAEDLSCLECPCNTTTAFNASCSPDASGGPTCFCRPGHEDPLCDTCSSGYFGQPPEFRCTRCDCNGNIDPSAPGSCDPSTGVCLECINNSTGSECELCAPGFYGDATQQDCQECECSVFGSVSGEECDPSSGQCSCLPGVGEMLCDSCVAGFWNLSAGVGCEPCDCAEGSSSGECDQLSGQCSCNEGITGDDCSRCLDGFFNFSPTGCTPCGCGIGASAVGCSQGAGQCSCQPGVEGDKCDACAAFHLNLTALGCQPCGECEQMLREELMAAGSELQLAEEGISLFETLLQSDVAGFAEISRLEEELSEDVLDVNVTIVAFEEGLGVLSATIETVATVMDGLQARIEASTASAVDLSPFADQVFEYIQEVYNSMEEILTSVGDINQFVGGTQAILNQQEEEARNTAGNISAIALMHVEDFSEQVSQLQALLEEAMSVSDQAVSSLSTALYQRNVTERLAATYNGIVSNTTALSADIASLAVQLETVNNAIAKLSAASAELRTTVGAITRAVEYATSSSSDSVIALAQDALNSVQEEAIPTLEALLGILSMSFGSGSGSGLVEATPPPVASPSLAEGLVLLQSGVEELEDDLIECAMVVGVACEVASELQSQAAEIESILRPSLTAGNTAIGAFIDFSNATRMIEMALNLTEQTEAALQSVQEMADLLMTAELREEVELLLTRSSQLLLVSLRSLEDTVATLSVAATEAGAIVDQAEQLARNISALEESLAIQVTKLESATAVTLVDVERSLQSTLESLQLVTTAFHYVSSVLPVDVSEATRLLNQTIELVEDADASLDLANVTVLEAAGANNRRSERLMEIAAMADAYEAELGAIEGEMSQLRTLRDAAIQAVASIDVALRFYGNSSLRYQLPAAGASSESLSVSLVFRPADTGLGLLLATLPGEGLLGVALQLSNGSVEADYDDVTIASPVGSLAEEEWYQLYATRERNRAQLSVAPLQGGVAYTASADVPDFPSPSPEGGASIVLGGHPLYQAYSGCVDHVRVNSVQLPLLLPDPLPGEAIATCGPRPPAEPARVFGRGVWFRGAGSHLVAAAPPSLSSSELSVEFAFRSLAENGLLLQVFSENMARYVSLSLSAGRVVLELSAFDFISIETASSFNTGLWYTVSANITQTDATLVVNGTETVTAPLPSLVQQFNTSAELFVGGLTPAVEELVMSGRPSLAGCLRDLQVNSEPVDLQDSLASARVSFEGCPASVVSGVRFMGDGSVAVFAVESAEELQQLSFSFRTTQLATTLLQLPTSQSGLLSVSVYHTKLRLQLGDTVVVTESALNDNRWHDVTITTATSSIGTTTIELDVDGTSTTVAIATVPATGGTLSVGGTRNASAAIVAESLRGCLDFLTLNTRSLDFNTAEVLEGVALFGCRPASLSVPSPPPPPPLPPPPSQPPLNATVGLDGANGSFVALLVSQEELLDSYLIVLQFQTVALLEDVLLLYTQDRMYIDYLALELQAGTLLYSFNLGSGRVYITSQGSQYNDGGLHTVELYRSARFGEMVVDGSDKSNATSPEGFTALNVNAGVLFLGGTPVVKPPSSLLWPGIDAPSSALACFHTLSVNGIYYDLRSPQASSGAGQCLATYNNLATFGPASYLVLAERFYAGVELAVSLDFRSTRCSGLLLYVASSFHPDHFLLELAGGSVRFVFDNGPGEVLVEYTPANASLLCDGSFHTLDARKEGVAGSLRVDGALVASGRSPDSEANFVAINTNDPLYLGGVPAGTPTRFTSVAESFQGCLSNVFIQQGGAEGEQEGVVFAQAEEFENVSFNTCTP